MIVAAGNNVSQIDDEGWSVLHHAARRGCSLKVFVYLIQSGADATYLDRFDTSVLMVFLRCAEEPLCETVQYLIDSGCSVG